MTTIDGITASPTRRRTTDAASASLLLVQALIGYEWLLSGLSKVANHDFPRGLGTQLDNFVRTAPDWYARFLSDAVVPRAAAAGYVIEWAEVGLGVVLLVAAVPRIRSSSTVVPNTRRAIRATTAVALVLGVVLAANFELANGGSFGLRLAANSFGEGVDLDTLMVAAQLALLVPLVAALRRSRTDDIRHGRSTR